MCLRQAKGDHLPQLLEPASGDLPTLSMPGVANGRIEQPGDVDSWKFAAVSTSPLKVEVRAARLGSPLDAVLVIDRGKQL